MTSLLDFINRIRTLQELPEILWIDVSRAECDHETECVLARALGVPVGGSNDPESGPESRFVMRFPDRLTARRVGIVTGLAWRADPPEVELPLEVADVAVSAHYDLLEESDFGELVGWWVPIDEEQNRWRIVRPADPIIQSDCGRLPAAA